MNEGALDQVIDAWMDLGPTSAPDRVVEAARLETQSTSQTAGLRGWPPRRFLHMSTTLRWGAAAVVIAALALAGITYFGGRNVGISNPTPTVSPSRAPSPSATPVVNGALPAADGIPEGSYIIGDPFPVEMGLRIGSGWSMWGGPFDSQVGAIYEGSPDDHGIIFVIVNNVYADACDPGAGAMTPELGPTVDDLATALADQAGTESSDPVPVTIDGHDGLYLDYSYPGGECAHLTRWPTSAGDRLALTGERDQVWILDVDGTRLVVDAFSFPGTTDEDLAEMREMVEGLDLPPLAGG
jgi:hypothetical protein